MKKMYLKGSLLFNVFGWKMWSKWRPGVAQMPLKNRPRKSNKGLIKETPSQDPSKEGFGEGFGWIWGAFWEGSGGIWEAWGSPYGHENQYISKEIQVLPPGFPKVGFVEGFGRVWNEFGRILNEI